MPPSKPIYSVMTYCIICNIFFGNLIGWLFFWKNEPAPILIALSISCIFCYYFVFVKVNFAKYKTFPLIMLSVLTCIVILFIGSILSTTYITAVEAIESNTTIFLSLYGIVVGIIFGILANMIMMPLILVMGLVNSLWFIKAQKIMNETYAEN